MTEMCKTIHLPFLVLSLIVFLVVRTSKTEKSNIWTQECINDTPLGLISGEVTDQQITASSTYPGAWARECEPRNARLFAKGVASWCAKFKSSSEWLLVDLGVAAQVTGVMTQGRQDGSEWVTSFKISHSTDGIHYKYAKDVYNNQKVFEGNSDAYTVKHNYLDSVITARFIKFHVFAWKNHPSLRVEVVGCQACKKALAIPPYSRFTASSAKGGKRMKTCMEEYGHIYSNKAWCSKRQDTRQWLQVDIGPPTAITGVSIRGRGDTKRRHWVTEFKVSYSNDSRVWFFYKETSFLDPKVFEGNKDKDNEQTHYLRTPIIARFVRFHPIKWRGRISMRIGLVGCPYRGDCGTGFFRINNMGTCVANLAYKKSAWLNQDRSRHRKRHLAPGPAPEQQSTWDSRQASRAVDGQVKRCTVLRRRWPYTEEVPAWHVDLRDRTTINGVVIYTGGKKGSNVTSGLNHQYLDSLERLAVFASKKPNFHSSPSSLESPTLCGYVTRLNDAIFQPRVHIPCRNPMKSRYLYIEASGIGAWNKDFGAVLCEVMVY